MGEAGGGVLRPGRRGVAARPRFPRPCRPDIKCWSRRFPGRLPMFLLIDNYDSFTYNLWHYLGELGAEVAVKRNDALSAEEALALKPQGIVISPGPSDPDHAGICLELISGAGHMPILGVCLGHQAIGQAFGGKLVRAKTPMHGKISQIRHGGAGVFKNLPNPFPATRYHSLIVERESLPKSLSVTAETED